MEELVDDTKHSEDQSQLDAVELLELLEQHQRPDQNIQEAQLHRVAGEREEEKGRRAWKEERERAKNGQDLTTICSD